MNLFQQDNLLLIKKNKLSGFYDTIVDGIWEYSPPKTMTVLEWDNQTDVFQFNRQIENIIERDNISALICLAYYYIQPKLLLKIQEKVWRIKVDGDDEEFFDHFTRWYGGLFDVNVTTSNYVKIKLEELDYRSLVIPTFLKSTPVTNKPIDCLNTVAFVGLLKGKFNRTEYINHLKQSGVPITHYGLDSESGYLDEHEKNSVFETAAISLNFTGVSCDFIGANDFPDLKRKKQMKGRPFEVIRSGGFLMTEESEDLNYFLKENVHYVSFSNKNELLEKIQHYLTHRDQRDEIAERGKKYFEENLSYQKAFPQFLKELSIIRAQKSLLESVEMSKHAKFFLLQWVRPGQLIQILTLDRGKLGFPIKLTELLEYLFIRIVSKLRCSR